MQLDNTRIAVRERGMLDTFDLALRVVRREFLPVTFSFAALAGPLFLLNHWLLGWILESANRELFYADDIGIISRYIWDMALLISIEAPLASLLTTAYLGQAMFVERPAWKPLGRDVMHMLPRIVWTFVLIRGIAAAWLLLMSLTRYGDFEPTVEIVGLGGLGLYVFGLRFWRPYLVEIILLERNPLVSRGQRAITVARRSQQLHGPSSGDLLVRGVATALLATVLTAAVFGSFLFFSGVFLNAWRPPPLVLAVLLPLAMWVVALFLTVVRFLSYLDLRIRHEGWEVELRMRAEGERLRNRLKT